MKIIKISKYRQRIYELYDGTISYVFDGENPWPTAKLLSDKDIENVITISDHIEEEAPESGAV